MTFACIIKKGGEFGSLADIDRLKIEAEMKEQLITLVVHGPFDQAVALLKQLNLPFQLEDNSHDSGYYPGVFSKMPNHSLNVIDR